jgi:hypothetical protein
LALYWLFSSGVGVKFAQSSSQWEIYLTLLTNKKQGNLNCVKFAQSSSQWEIYLTLLTNKKQGNLN